MQECERTKVRRLRRLRALLKAKARDIRREKQADKELKKFEVQHKVECC